MTVGIEQFVTTIAWNELVGSHHILILFSCTTVCCLPVLKSELKDINCGTVCSV